MMTAEEARRLLSRCSEYNSEEMALIKLNSMIEKACQNEKRAILVFNLCDSLSDKLKNLGYKIIKGNTLDNGNIQYIISWKD